MIQTRFKNYKILKVNYKEIVTLIFNRFYPTTLYAIKNRKSRKLDASKIKSIGKNRKK